MAAVLRIAVTCLVGGWLGALCLFAFVIAPNVFDVLPGAAIANQVVGPILRSLNYYGIAAGLALAALAWIQGRRWPLLALPLVLAAASAYSEFVITAQISGVLPHELGPSSPADAAARFSFLHQLSTVVFSGILLGVMGLIVGHGLADRDAPGRWS